MANLHQFEIAGLGRAPFRFVRMERHVNADGFPCGTCDYCGNGLKYVYIVKGCDDKPEFRVGSDCVEKTLQGNNVLLDNITRAKKRLDRETREAKRKAKALADWKAREAQLQAERDANGGKTLADLRWEAEKAAKDAQEAEDRAYYTAENGWILEAIKPCPGDFVASICKQLEKGSLLDIGQRATGIVAEIYSKTFGRMNSNKYKEAYEDFWKRYEALKAADQEG